MELHLMEMHNSPSFGKCVYLEIFCIYVFIENINVFF